jgi:hypothetical protein
MKHQENVPGRLHHGIRRVGESYGRVRDEREHGALLGQENDPRVLSIALAASFELGVAEAARTRTAQTHLPLFMSPALPRQDRHST